MTMKPTPITLKPVACLGSLLAGGELVAFDVGPNGLVYLVIALKPLDYHIVRAGATFARTTPQEPQDYRVIALRGDQTVRDIHIDGEQFNVHSIQPLGAKLLLTCTRSYYRGEQDFDLNGRLYSSDGAFEKELLLGDGICSVQVDPHEIIWTSYFDEGIFGNCGWRNPIGACGLVAWDTDGNKLYEFQ